MLGICVLLRRARLGSGCRRVPALSSYEGLVVPAT